MASQVVGRKALAAQANNNSQATWLAIEEPSLILQTHTCLWQLVEGLELLERCLCGWPKGEALCVLTQRNPRLKPAP